MLHAKLQSVENEKTDFIQQVNKIMLVKRLSF